MKERSGPSALPRGGLLAAAALVVAAVLAGTGCASSSTGSGGNASNAATSGLLVRMTEFRFNPAALTVRRNAKVTVVNSGQVPHSWVIADAGVGSAAVAPGGSQTVDLSGVAPGTYRVFCDQPGHAAAGQTGELTVTP